MKYIREKPELLINLGSVLPDINSIRNKKCGVFKCHCGAKFISIISAITRGDISQCKVCANRPLHTQHPLYSTWSSMMARTSNITHPRWDSYGGRGITVCEEWKDPYKFYEDMFPSYTKGLSIDRIDNNKGYYLENCRWATQTMQSINTRLIQANNKSGYRGASFNKAAGKWIAYLVVDSKRKYLGYHETALEAAKAYDKYVLDNNLIHPINGVL